MNTIYRIERPHKTRKIGLGAYRYPSPFRQYILDHHNGDDHPSIHQDFGVYDVSTLDYCACPTFDKLRIWFEDMLEFAYESGLMVAEYEVNEFRVGKSNIQCVFRKEDIINKRYLRLGDVLKE